MDEDAVAVATTHAEYYTSHELPSVVVDKCFCAPLRNLKAQLDESGAAFDTVAFVSIMQLIEQYCCQSAESYGSNHDDDASRAAQRKVIVDLMFEAQVLSDVGNLAVRYNICEQGQATGRGIGAGYVEGPPDQKLGVRVLRRVCHLVKQLLYDLRHPDSGLAGHASALINTVVQLYLGEVNFPLGRSSGISHTLASCWDANLHDLFRDLVTEMFTEEGSGNFRYKPIRASIASSVGDSTTTDTIVMHRGAAYYSDLTELGKALAQIQSLQTGRTSSGRKNGLMKIAGLLQPTHDAHVAQQKGQLLLDARMAEKVVAVSSSSTLQMWQFYPHKCYFASCRYTWSPFGL